MIPVFKPWYTEHEEQAVAEVLRSGWTGLGPKVREFERKMMSFLYIKYAFGLNSCTSALHLALDAIDVCDYEVITTPLTFVSTSHAIIHAGGIPVFCDVKEDDLNIDETKIEGLITDLTKAIVVVHYGGRACSMDPIIKIAKKHNLMIVEDAAHGMGGLYKRRHLGTCGHFGCFSFHTVKNMGIGDGGMVVTKSAAYAAKIKRMRWLGIDKSTYDRNKNDNYSWEYDVSKIGYKYHMNDISAALALCQLDKLALANRNRWKLGQMYDEALEGVGDIRLTKEIEDSRSACHNYVIRTERRNELHEYLKQNNISTSVHYKPNHLYPIYRECKADCPVVEREWLKLLTLPLYPQMTKIEHEAVVSKIRKFFK